MDKLERDILRAACIVHGAPAPETAVALRLQSIAGQMMGQTVSVRFADSLPHGAIGSYVSGTQRVTLRRDLLKNAEELLLTLFHELSHAIWPQYRGAAMEHDCDTMAFHCMATLRAECRRAGLSLDEFVGI